MTPAARMAARQAAQLEQVHEEMGGGRLLTPSSAPSIPWTINLATNPSLETQLAPWIPSNSSPPVNGVLNPSAETNLTGWFNFVSGGTSVLNRITTDAWQGSSCAEVVGTTVPALGNVQTGIAGSGNGLTVTTGDIVFFSIAVKATLQAATGGAIGLSVKNTPDGSVTTPAGTAQSIASPVVGQWYVLSAWLTITTQTNVGPIAVYGVPNTAGNYTLRGDAAMACKVGSTSIGVNYIDGDQPGCVWLGTAHASQSRQLGLVNYITNPNGETDVAGYSVSGTATSQSVTRSTAWSDQGSASIRCTGTLAAGQFGGIASSPSNSYKVVPGVPFTFSCVFNKVTTPGQVQGKITWRDSAGANLGVDTFGTTYTAIGIQESVTTGTAPAGSAYAQIAVFGVAGTTGNYDYAVDSLMLTATPAGIDYFDGNVGGGTWVGTANASVSTLGIISRVSNYTGAGSIQNGTAYGRLTGRLHWGGADLYCQCSAGGTGAIPITPNLQYTFAADLLPVTLFTSNGTLTVRTAIQWWNSSGTFVANSFSSSISTVTGSKTRVGVTVNAPGTAAFATGIIIVSRSSGTADLVADVYFDSARFSLGADGTYFDGDYPYGFWTGTPNISTSQQRSTPIAPTGSVAYAPQRYTYNLDEINLDEGVITQDRDLYEALNGNTAQIELGLPFDVVQL